MQARQETFLARYPRKLKVCVSLVLTVILVTPIWAGGRHHRSPVEKNASGHTLMHTAITGSESQSAIANAPFASNVVSVPVTPDTGDDTKASKPSVLHAPADDAAIDTNDTSLIFMAPAPDPGLVEDFGQGSLPRIGEDGRQPWQVYARPFNTADKRPRVAIVITDLGLSRLATDTAINRLPPNVTLAFDTQSPVAGAWCARARQAGHETILMLPMEPFDYPRSDPGPNTLLSNLPNSDNIQRLQVALSQASGYIGITTLSGSRFTTDPAKITPILEALHKRGLMVFDARVAPHSAIADLAHEAHVPAAVNTLKLDQNLSPQAIDDALTQLEQTARLSGQAVAMAPPLPVIVDRLNLWIKQLPHDGVVLAPLSAMAQ